MTGFFHNVAASIAVGVLFATPIGAAHTSKWAKHWPGWEGIKYMVVFGDSYTTTGFNDTLAQPSRANPLGNPAYPGYTASNGPNWVVSTIGCVLKY